MYSFFFKYLKRCHVVDVFALTSTSLLVTSTRAYVRASHSSSIAVKENASLPFSSPPLPDFLMLTKNKKKEANAALSPTKISPRNRDATGERFSLFSLPLFVPLSSWISLSLIYIYNLYLLYIVGRTAETFFCFAGVSTASSPPFSVHFFV